MDGFTHTFVSLHLNVLKPYDLRRCQITLVFQDSAVVLHPNFTAYSS